MGIRHLTTFLRPYATAESLAGREVVIDGPSFAHQIYYICLSASPSARTALEAAPSYQALVAAAFAWLDGLRGSNVVIKKIYFDGFLPPTKLDIRLQRLQSNTQQLSQFHQAHTEPCRASFPNPDISPRSLDLFQTRSGRPGLTTLPALSFVVPAILEALQISSKYGEIVEVVPGEADLYCGRYLKENGGIVLTSDSDLLVHDLGPTGAVSFFSDIKLAGNDYPGLLSTQIFEPAAITDRLVLPTSHGLHSLAFEIFMDCHGTFRKLLTQAQSLKAVTEHPQMFQDFLKEYAQLPLAPSVKTEVAATVQVLRTLDPRISEYVLQFPSLGQLAGQQLVSEKPASISPRVFLPFLLDSPIRTNAWEASTAIRQLAYGLANLTVPDNEHISNVFEHKKQMDKSQGRDLKIPTISEIPEACTSISELFLKLKMKLQAFTDAQIWIAVAVHQDIEWSNFNSKTPIVQLFMQNMAQLESSKKSEQFSWDVIQFFAQLHGSLYALRMLKQISDLVASDESKKTILGSVFQLNDQLESLPRMVEYPDLGSVSSVIRNSEAAHFLADMKTILGAMDNYKIAVAPKSTKQTKAFKKKRKREQATSDVPASKARSSNPFDLLAEG